jgi:hypothetical protein
LAAKAGAEASTGAIMGRHEFQRWIADTLLKIVSALWQRDSAKAIFGIAIVCVALFVVWRRRYRFRGITIPAQLNADAISPQEQWRAPTAEEVDRVINKRR